MWGGWARENIKMFTEHSLQLMHSTTNMDVETEKLGGVVWSGFQLSVDCGMRNGGGSKDTATTCIDCYHICFWFYDLSVLFVIRCVESRQCNVRWPRSGRRSETSKHGVDANARSRARHLGGPLNRAFASIVVIILIVLKMGEIMILWIIKDRCTLFLCVCLCMLLFQPKLIVYMCMCVIVRVIVYYLYMQIVCILMCVSVVVYLTA